MMQGESAAKDGPGVKETTRKTAGTGSFYTSCNALRKRRNKVDFSPFYRENLGIDSQFAHILQNGL